MVDETTSTTVSEVLSDSTTYHNDNTYRLHFYEGTLTVSRVTQENDQEVVTPVIIQPWRTNNDGTRQNFKDASDAYDWFENYKQYLS